MNQKPNWRRSYHEFFENKFRTLMRQRHESGCLRPYDMDGQSWQPTQMSEEQCRWLAWRLAERHLQRAINKHNANIDRSKKRSGHAL